MENFELMANFKKKFRLVIFRAGVFFVLAECSRVR